jgi:hypothetical protein
MQAQFGPGTAVPHRMAASALITSQFPLDEWHAYLGDRIVAETVLDRLVLKGASMRRHKSVAA